MKNMSIFLKTINQQNSLLYFFHLMKSIYLVLFQFYYTNNDALQQQKYCATLTFIPKFNEVSLDDAYTQYLDGLSIAENQVIKRGNYLFIIDRSGSMSGSRIAKAKESLILFLKSLPQDSEFNIISFGIVEDFEPMWNESQKYSQTTLETAIEKVKIMNADMGGTKIITPLKSMIYNQNYGVSKQTTLNVFLLTDGEDDADPIINLVQSNNQAQTRIYTLGIGEGCSQYLIQRVAEVGNGKYQIVSDKEDINEKVIDLLEDSLTPYLQAFNLESNVINISQIIPNPESIVCLKKNQELTIQILFSMEQQQENLEFKINCYDPQNEKQIQYSVKLNLNQSQNNEYFHKLATYKFITYYENSIKYGQQHVNFIKLNKQNLDQKDIVNLSVQHQILCSRTAFVCAVCDLEDEFQQQIKSIESITLHQQTRQYICRQSLNLCQNQIDQIDQFQKQDQQRQSRILHEDQMTRLDKQCLDFDQRMLSSIQICRVSDGNMRHLSSQKTNSSSGCCGGGGSQSNYAESNSFYPSPQKQNQQSLQTELLQKNYEQTEVKIQKTDYDKLTYEQLIQFAQADGSFKISKEIQSIINFKNLKNHLNLKDNVWFTFLVLLYLENNFGQSKKSWQLVYQKGILFLKQNGIDYKTKRDEYQL